MGAATAGGVAEHQLGPRGCESRQVGGALFLGDVRAPPLLRVLQLHGLHHHCQFGSGQGAAVLVAELRLRSRRAQLGFNELKSCCASRCDRFFTRVESACSGRLSRKRLLRRQPRVCGADAAEPDKLSDFFLLTRRPRDVRVGRGCAAEGAFETCGRDRSLALLVPPWRGPRACPSRGLGRQPRNGPWGAPDKPASAGRRRSSATRPAPCIGFGPGLFCRVLVYILERRERELPRENHRKW